MKLHTSQVIEPFGSPDRIVSGKNKYNILLENVADGHEYKANTQIRLHISVAR